MLICWLVRLLASLLVLLFFTTTACTAHPAQDKSLTLRNGRPEELENVCIRWPTIPQSERHLLTSRSAGLSQPNRARRWWAKQSRFGISGGTFSCEIAPTSPHARADLPQVLEPVAQAWPASRMPRLAGSRCTCVRQRWVHCSRASVRGGVFTIHPFLQLRRAHGKADYCCIRLDIGAALREARCACVRACVRTCV